MIRLKLFPAVCITLLSVFFHSFSSFAQQPVEIQDIPAVENFKTAVITYDIIPSLNNTYGYDVFVDGKMRLHQPNIPGVQGNNGFKTKEKAERVVKLVIMKLREGDFPPTITMDDLKRLKAL